MIQAITCTYRKMLVFPIFPYKTLLNSVHERRKVSLARLLTRLALSLFYNSGFVRYQLDSGCYQKCVYLLSAKLASPNITEEIPDYQKKQENSFQSTVNKIDTLTSFKTILPWLPPKCKKNNVGIIYQLLKKETHLIDKFKLLIFKEKTCHV